MLLLLGLNARADGRSPTSTVEITVLLAQTHSSPTKTPGLVEVSIKVMISIPRNPYFTFIAITMIEISDINTVYHTAKSY